MRKFNQKTVKGTWVDFPEDKEVKIQIRPFSLFNLTKLPSEDNVDFTQFWDIFKFCVLDWKGIQDINGKDLKCDDENKRMIFDFDQELILFVVNESSRLRSEVIPEKEIKNLSTSQPGETQKKEK